MQANEYHIVLCIAGPYHTTHMSLTSRLHVRNITRLITDKYALIHFEQDFIISMDSFNMLTEITANNQRLYYLTFVTNTLEDIIFLKSAADKYSKVLLELDATSGALTRSGGLFANPMQTFFLRIAKTSTTLTHFFCAASCF